jgi:hypothetical protein
MNIDLLTKFTSIYSISITLIFSLVFFVIAIHIIFSKTPIIFPTKRFFISALIFYLIILLYSIQSVFKYGQIDKSEIMYLLLGAFFLISLLLKMKGYFIWGINIVDYRNVIIKTLNSLKLHYEESRSRIYISDQELTIHITLDSLFGISQIQLMKGNYTKFNKVVEKLKLNIYKTKVRINYTISVIGIICSIIYLFTATIILISKHIL